MIDKAVLVEYASNVTKLNDIDKQLAERKEKYEEEIECLQTIKKDLNTTISGLKEKLEEQGKQEFKETAKKQLTGGLGIREGSEYIYEESKAFAWAKEHSMCLSLDKKAFEKVAEVTPIDFIEKKPKITVTFPKEIKLEE